MHTEYILNQNFFPFLSIFLVKDQTYSLQAGFDNVSTTSYADTI